MFTFAHDSDLHYGKTRLDPRRLKDSHPKKIIESDAEFVILTGDLTDNGYNDAHIGCIHYGGHGKQLSTFMRRYVKPLEEADREVFMCAGNHDRGKRLWKINIYPAVHHLIKKKYGGLNYTFERKGLYFVCCHEYPKNINWLKKQLKDIRQPTIIFFHFNLEGPHSDWWNNKAKDAFYDAIKDYKVVALLFGHHHISKVGEWRGIKTISSSNAYSLITYDQYTEDIVGVKHVR